MKDIDQELLSKIECDVEDSDLLQRKRWRFDKQSQRIVRTQYGVTDALHRLIAERMLEPGDSIEGKIVKLNDGNPFNVRRGNLLIGTPPVEHFIEDGYVFFHPGNSDLLLRISPDDLDELHNYWFLQKNNANEITGVSTNQPTRSLSLRIAEKKLGRPLHKWEKMILKDNDPLHCDRENIDIVYKKTHLQPADLHYDQEDIDLITGSPLMLDTENAFYITVRHNGTRKILHRLIMERKLRRPLFMMEKVKHYDEDQFNVRRSNLYIKGMG